MARYLWRVTPDSRRYETRHYQTRRAAEDYADRTRQAGAVVTVDRSDPITWPTDPAPDGVSAAPTSRGGPIGPAGAPIPTTSEEQCERCGRILDCCRRCPVHEGDVDE